MQHGDITCCRLFLKDYMQYSVHHDHTPHDIHVCDNLPRCNTYLICPTHCPIVGKSYHNIPYLDMSRLKGVFFLHESRRLQLLIVWWTPMPLQTLCPTIHRHGPSSRNHFFGEKRTRMSFTQSNYICQIEVSLEMGV